MKTLTGSGVAAPHEGERKIDYILGVHSNIPLCCVRFFVQAGYERIGVINATRGYDASPGYVMCNACWDAYAVRGTLAPADVHRCTSRTHDPICRYYLSAPEVYCHPEARRQNQKELERALGYRIIW